MAGVLIGCSRWRGSTRMSRMRIDSGRWCDQMRSLMALVGIVANGSDGGRHDGADQKAGSEYDEMAGHGVVAGS